MVHDMTRLNNNIIPTNYRWCQESTKKVKNFRQVHSCHGIDNLKCSTTIVRSLALKYYSAASFTIYTFQFKGYRDHCIAINFTIKSIGNPLKIWTSIGNCIFSSLICNKKTLFPNTYNY